MNFRKIVGAFFLVIGILFMLVYAAAICMFYDKSLYFFGIGGLLLTIVGGCKLYFKENIIKKHVPIVFYLARVAIILFVISFIAIESLILSYSFSYQKSQAKYIVVLGAMVRGKTPSLILTERLDAAIKCSNEHQDAKIIVSGAKGSGEDISEAEAMKTYLIGKDIPEDKIIMEDKSFNTMGNLKNSHKLMQDEKNLIIVTSEFHEFRARFLAKRLGLNAACYPAKTKFYLKPTYYLREYLAVVKSFIVDKA